MMDCTVLTHPSAGVHLGGFHFLAPMNNAAVNIHVQVFARAFALIFLGQIPGSGIAGSNKWSLLRNCQISKQLPHLTLLPAASKCSSTSLCSPILTTLLSLFSILVGVKWCLTVVLICSFLIMHDLSLACRLFLPCPSNCTPIPSMSLGPPSAKDSKAFKPCIRSSCDPLPPSQGSNPHPVHSANASLLRPSGTRGSGEARWASWPTPLGQTEEEGLQVSYYRSSYAIFLSVPPLKGKLHGGRASSVRSLLYP